MEAGTLAGTSVRLGFGCDSQQGIEARQQRRDQRETRPLPR